MVMLVGALFDDIYIKRFDDEGNETELIKVPITYAPKDKMLARVMQDPDIDRPTAMMPLPMISFEMGQMKYDRDRKLHTTGKSAVFDPSNPNSFKAQYNPVPYNMDFRVYIYAKNVEDGNKILEQILPFFTPDWTTSVKMIPEMNITMDIPVVLSSISYSDNYDRAFKERRASIWELDLSVKTYFYGPIKEKPVIKYVNTSFYIANTVDIKDSIGNVPLGETMITLPGLDANGNPTSNIALTIPANEITAQDNYGYIREILHPGEVANVG